MVGPDRLGYIYIYAHINSIYICALYVLPQAPSAAGRRAVWCRNSATPRLAPAPGDEAVAWRHGMMGAMSPLIWVNYGESMVNLW